MINIYKPMDFYTVDKSFTARKDGVLMTHTDVSRDLNDNRRRFLTLKQDNEALRSELAKIKTIIGRLDL